VCRTIADTSWQRCNPFLQDRRRDKSSYPDQRDLHLLTPLAPSQRLVRAIAERRGLGLLALAQGDFFLFIY
jgi:hypothetical protein